MVYFIYFVILVSFIDTFSQLPIISPYAQGLGATPLLIGIVVGIYSFSNIIGNIFAGFWIDKDGAKRVLYIALALTGLILLVYVWASSPAQLIVVRFLHGLSSGFLVPAAFTFLANRSKDSKKGKSMALSGAVVGLAAIIGPAFGGIVTSAIGIHWVFITIGVLMVVTAPLAFFLLPHTDAKMSRRIDHHGTGKSVLDLLKMMPLFYAYLGSFSLMFSQGVLAYMLPLKIEALRYGSEVSGMLLSVFAMTAILIFVLPTNRLYDRFTYEYTMTSGLVVLGISLLLLSTAASLTYMFLIMMLYGIGFALIFPTINALIAHHTTSLERGKAFGLFYAFFSLGVVAGSTVTGALHVSADGAFLIGAGVLFASSSLLVLLMRKRMKVST